MWDHQCLTPHPSHGLFRDSFTFYFYTKSGVLYLKEGLEMCACTAYSAGLAVSFDTNPKLRATSQDRITPLVAVVAIEMKLPYC
jgi:hypothetical protein